MNVIVVFKVFRCNGIAAMSATDIPLFDSLAHPSLDGSWINPRWSGQNSFPQVIEAMKEANVRWAWAVSMGTRDGYDVDQYVQQCAKAEVRMFPAAFMNVSEFSSLAAAEDWLVARNHQGFLGVKLHPRLGRFDFQHPFLPSIIGTANRLGLIPLLCTYFYSAHPACRTLSMHTLRELLCMVPDQKLILLHGGLMHVLEMSEMTRHFKNTLLDLSFTLCEFAGTSVDLDLRYVMDRCQGRTCLGSDSPEFQPSRVRERFEELTRGFSLEHREKLAFRNMFEFTGLPAGF